MSGDDVVIGLGEPADQARRIRELIAEWGTADGPTRRNVVCWTPRWAWIVLARDKRVPVPPLQAIGTVNALIETSHPGGGYIAEAVHVVAHLDALLASLEGPLLGSMTQPLDLCVLADWGAVMLLYYELADKLLAAKRPELACQVLATSLEHNRDFLYDPRWMEAFEIAALSAGDKPLPIVGLPASAVLEEVQAHRARARPLPAVARGYAACLYYPVRTEADWKVVHDPPVVRPLPSLANEVETLWEGVLLARSLQRDMADPSPDVVYFTATSILNIRALWPRLDAAARARVDAFSMKVCRRTLSAELGLKDTPEL